MPTIHRLSEEVINKIAAGEVVQRPSAALKELLENSLDAHADEISVIAADGGLAYLQVRDNGCGIGYDDLPLLCARHATSKLKNVNELYSITSFGFRGEALASLSYVSNVKVITRKRAPINCVNSVSLAERSSVEPSSCSSSCENIVPDNIHTATQVAWEAHYCNSQLIHEPIPVAGNEGTTIIAENMFYNTQVRLKSIKPTEEWNRLREVVVKYALAFPSVGFSVQRINRTQIDPANSLRNSRNARSSQELDYVVFPKYSTTRRNLQLIFANTISSHLHLIAFTTFKEKPHLTDKKTMYTNGNNSNIFAGVESIEDESKIDKGNDKCCKFTKETSVVDSEECSTKGEEEAITSITCSGKLIQKMSFEEGMQQFALWGYISDSFVTNNRKHFLCLFVNNRLVECSAVRKMLDSLYSSISINNNTCKYVAVIMLYLPCSRVDVNIHPTKQEVRMFDELSVVAKMSEIIRETISKISSTLQPLNSALIANSNIPANIAALSSIVNLKSEISTLTEEKCSNSSRQVDVTSEAFNITNKTNSVSSNSDKDKFKNNGSKGNVQASMLNINGFMKNTSFTLPPSCMVRIEPQKGALDRYMQSRNNNTTNNNKTIYLSATESEELNVEETEYVTNVQAEVSTLAMQEADIIHTATHTLPVKRRREEVLKESDDDDNTIQELNEQNKKSELEQHVVNIVEENEKLECAIVERSTQDLVASAAAAGADNDVNDDDTEEDNVLMLKEFKQFQQRSCTHENIENMNVDTNANNEVIKSCNKVDFSDKNYNNKIIESELYSSLSSSIEYNEEQSDEQVSSNNNNLKEETLSNVKEDVFVLLTSVQRIVQAIHDESSNSAQQFFTNMSFVGVVNKRCFLVQVDTTLYIVSTFHVVREAIYQRLFMRWASAELSFTRAPSFTLSTPLSVSDLLYHTLAFNTCALWPPSPLLRKLIESSIQESMSTNRRNSWNTEMQQEWSKYDFNSSTPPSSCALRHLLFDVDENVNGKSNSDKEERCNVDKDNGNAHVSEACTGITCMKEKHLNEKSEELRYHLTPTSLTRRYVQRLIRRLRHWSEMLSEYFGVVFHTFHAGKSEHESSNTMLKKQKQWTENLYLLSLPAGLNLHWPPTPELIPLFVWQLAERVPYPSESYNKINCDSSNTVQELKKGETHCTKTDSIDDEIKCFRAIAHCIANTLYKIEIEEYNTHAHKHELSKTSSLSANEQNKSDNDIVKDNVETNKIWHVLLPCVQNAQLFKPPARFLTDRTIQSVVSVETLYKIFERC